MYAIRVKVNQKLTGILNNGSVEFILHGPP